MAHQYSPRAGVNGDPNFIDRTYASGVAQERPKLATRIFCHADEEATMSEANLSGPGYERGRARVAELAEMRDREQVPSESQEDWFKRELRSGSGFRNSGDE